MKGLRRWLKGQSISCTSIKTEFRPPASTKILAVGISVAQTLGKAETGQALGLAGCHLAEKELAPGSVRETISRQQGKDWEESLNTDFYTHLAHAGVLRKKWTSAEKMLLLDWPLGNLSASSWFVNDVGGISLLWRQTWAGGSEFYGKAGGTS